MLRFNGWLIFLNNLVCDDKDHIAIAGKEEQLIKISPFLIGSNETLRSCATNEYS
jgi:hypothetical protein